MPPTSSRAPSEVGLPPTSPSLPPTGAAINNNNNDNNVSGGTATPPSAGPSIAVFLFAKEKLLFRYPDVDPFIVDVATAGGGGSSSGGGAAAADAAPKKAGNNSNSNKDNASSNAGRGSNRKSNSNTAAAVNAEAGRGEAASATASAHSSPSSSRDRHHRRRGNGEGSIEAAQRSGKGAMPHPDSLTTTSSTPTVTAAPAAVGAGVAVSAGGSRLKKKSPHVHVAMAADVKDQHGGSPHEGTKSATAGAGGTASTLEVSVAASTSSTSGVAPQRGMRRPMSAYTLNDNLSVTLAGLSSPSSNLHGHRAVSPGGAGAANAGWDNRCGSQMRRGATGATSATMSGGLPSGPTTQVQNTATGSTRQQTSSSPSTKAASAAAPAARSNKSSHPTSSRAAALQQQQQQQLTSAGAATCVGIATNVLMHLLRGALNGCTTINMVNCTFLVFPLTLAMAAASSFTGVAAAAGAGASSSSHNTSGSLLTPAALDRQRPQPSRSATALLVIAMKQPDTDSGAIANFAQCFVNILCREEQRCHYVSSELDRMEALTNHWEVGGAAALAAAAAVVDQRQQHQPSQQHHLLDMAPPSPKLQQQQRQRHHSLSPVRVSAGDGVAHSTRDSSSSPNQALYTHVSTTAAVAALTEENDSDAAEHVHGDYDYLFAPPRPAVRGGKAATAAKESGSGAHRTSSHGTHGGSAAFWAEADYDGEGDDSRRGGSGTVATAAGSSVSRAASPSSGRDGGPRRRNGPQAVAAASPTATSATTSLYQQLATYVRLASEVQQVAQCIDMWNRTSRVSEDVSSCVVSNGGCSSRRRVPHSAIRNLFGVTDGQRAGYGGGGSGGAAVVGRGRGSVASPALRDPFRRHANFGANPHQQTWVTATPGEVLDALPDAILVNQMLLLPLAHLTGQERLEQAQATHSAYSRIHPCSIVTIVESQFTEELQRSYVDMMGRRYAKLIPLATVYALLLALPSPRRAGSLYRSIELTLLEAVQRRHARAAAAAGTNNNNSMMAPMMSASATNYSSAYAVDAAADEESVAAAAVVTTAAGLDFLAMEIIDFLRVHGAISVATEMWVSFTHAEVTPCEYVEAAAVRRRRHRLRAERRRERAAQAAAAAAAGDEGVAVQPHGQHKERHQRSRTQAPEVEETAMEGETAGAASTQDPFEEVRDMDTVPAALVLHMLERVVDTQQTVSQQQQQQLQTSSYMPTSASVASLNAGIGGPRVNGTDVETMSTATGGAPKSPSTGNTISAAVVTAAASAAATAVAVAASANGMARSPRSSETDTSAGRASYRGSRPLDTPTVTHALSNTSPLQQPQQPQQQQQQQRQQLSGAPTVRLSVYCAWGSACPLCEQLASHPQCWTTAVNKSYAVGYYVMNAARQLRSSPALCLDFPSLDASVCTCARHARRLREHTDLSSLMQSSYNISSGSSLVGQRGGGGGSGGLLHSLQPWFIRPDMFVTPVTAAYGVSPFEIFERMSYHSNRGNAGTSPSQRLQQQWAASGNGLAVAGVPLVVPVNNTSSLVEPERRDMLVNSRTQQANYGNTNGNGSPHEASASAAASRRGAAVGAVEEQGHTLLQCSDIAPEAVEYLRRNASSIRRRLAYARAQQAALERFERVCERHSSAQAQRGQGGQTPSSTTVAAAAAREQQPATRGVAASPLSATTAAPLERRSHSPTSPSVEGAASEAFTMPTTLATASNKSAPVSTATWSASRPMATASTQPTPVSTSAAAAAANRRESEPLASSSPQPLASSVGLAQLSSSADVRPRSIRYGRRQLPLHTATSPLTNVNFLFDSTTPTLAMPQAPRQEEHRRQEDNEASPQSHNNNNAYARQAELPMRSVGSNSGGGGGGEDGASSGFPFADVDKLLEGERSLPVEVLLQYVLHHLIALSWGRRGVEVDTLVRLLERNLRRLPPLLANLQYVHQLRNAGFTSVSAAAAVAALRAPAVASGGGAEGPAAVATSPSSAVFTTVHTRLAASPSSVSGGNPSPPYLPDTPENTSDTSPYSGGSRTATAIPVTESEVQLLQAYEVLEKLSLMELLSSYAMWPVHAVPTRLLLHTVVNEFCDVLYVDSSERDEEVDHWDLPVAAQ